MDNPYVMLETSEGEILLELFPDKAPLTVENFLQYVDSGHYDATLFHRVVRGFVNQGGGYTQDLKKKECREPITNEAANSLSNITGTIAMARTTEKDSACDEFFINMADNTFLDHQDETDEHFGYAVFGTVADGMDVAKKINWKVVKPRAGFTELPVDSVLIISARRFQI
jgi:cyclophilin family peptidyl-prolyl cis-trans isomerase